MSQAQKTPLAVGLNNFTQKKIEDFQQTLGQILPCHVIAVDGAIVTIAFDVLAGNLTIPQVTCPIAESEYIRLPVQVGDKGICMSADTRLGGVTGLGQGLAPLSTAGNLGGLFFVPLGNKNWFSVNGQYLVMYGPDGVEITTANQDCTLVLNSSGITISLNNGNLTINNGNTTMNGNLTVNGNISSTGNVTNNGKNVGSTHIHSGVQTGTSNTGVPV